MDSSAAITNQQLDAKRTNSGKDNSVADKTKQGTGKMIELDYYISSDEELWPLYTLILNILAQSKLNSDSGELISPTLASSYSKLGLIVE